MVPTHQWICLKKEFQFHYNMTDNLKKFIENNSILIHKDDMLNLYKKCPSKLKPELLQIFEDSGITINSEDQEVINNTLWGIKTPDLTLTIRAPKNGLWNCGYTINQGVQGGSQIGFFNHKKAQEFLDKFLGGNGYVSAMNPDMLRRYQWIEVPYLSNDGTTFFITKYYYDKYDPVKKAKKRAEKKAVKDFEKESYKLIENDIKKVKTIIDGYIGFPPQPWGPTLNNNEITHFIRNHNDVRITIYNVDIIEKDEQDLINEINKITDRKWVKMFSQYYDNNEGKAFNNKLYYLSLIPEDMEPFKELKDQIDRSYGL